MSRNSVAPGRIDLPRFFEYLVCSAFRASVFKRKTRSYDDIAIMTQHRFLTGKSLSSVEVRTWTELLLYEQMGASNHRSRVAEWRVENGCAFVMS